MAGGVSTISDVARKHGAAPNYLSDLFYKEILDSSRLVKLGNRRLIPGDYLPEVERVLAERLKPQEAAAN